MSAAFQTLVMVMVLGSLVVQAAAGGSNETTTTDVSISTTTSTTFQKVGTQTATTVTAMVTAMVTTTVTEMIDGDKIVGSWMISVSDPMSILDDAAASANFVQGVKNTLSTFSKISADLIDVVLSRGDRRLQALRSVRPGTGAIHAVYTINVPPSMAGMAEAAAVALSDASSSHVVYVLTAALSLTMVNPPVIEGIVATNPQKVAVGSVVPAPTTTSAPSAMQEESPPDGAHGQVSLSIAHALIALVLATSVLL